MIDKTEMVLRVGLHLVWCNSALYTCLMEQNMVSLTHSQVFNHAASMPSHVTPSSIYGGWNAEAEVVYMVGQVEVYGVLCKAVKGMFWEKDHIMTAPIPVKGKVYEYFAGWTLKKKLLDGTPLPLSWDLIPTPKV